MTFLKQNQRNPERKSAVDKKKKIDHSSKFKKLLISRR